LITFISFDLKQSQAFISADNKKCPGLLIRLPEWFLRWIAAQSLALPKKLRLKVGQANN
jgi:hypothetical protein